MQSKYGLIFNYNSMTNAMNRHNKLFNDYKTKQRIMNELQQKYLFKEGEKYTFYPIINNYIIKYNKPFFPSSTNTQIYYDKPSICINNLNNINRSYNNNAIKYIDTTPLEESYDIFNKRTTNRLKKSFQNKKNRNLGLIDENTNNNIYKKIQKFKSMNSTKSKKKAQKSKKSFENQYIIDLYEKRNNTYEKNIMNNDINKYQKISKPKELFLEKGKNIQKTNSIKTFNSNNSQVSKNNNKTYKNNNVIKTKNKNANLNPNKNMNNIFKINIPIEESNIYNMKIPAKRSFVNTITSINDFNFLNKSKEIKKTYTNEVNNRCNNATLSLKYLIQDENNKNKKNSKSKKSSNISKQKVNKIIDGIFNYKNLTNRFIKTPTLNNTLMINTDDYIDLNQNPNNIIVKQDNFNYYTIEENPIIISKNIKTESNYKKININNKYNNRIKAQKSYEKDTLANTKANTLTENQTNQNKQYSNKNTYKKNITLNQKDNLNNTNQVILFNSNGYASNINNNNVNQIYQSNNTTKSKQNKTLKEKEITIPIPNASYNKLYIPNKIKDGKNIRKNRVKDEENTQKFIYIKNRYKLSNDFNNTNTNTNNTNEETYQTNIYNTANVSKENRINSIINKSNNNTQSTEDFKNFFSLKSKNNVINTNANTNMNNNKINGNLVKNNNYSFGVEGKKKEKVILNNMKYNYNNYKIATNEINRYYYKDENDKESNIKEEGNENSDLSIQSISDSKVLEIANTYIDEHVDKSQVDGILTYKKKQSQYS